MSEAGDWTQTFCGKAFWFPKIDLDAIEIIDIAHALGNICRYGGHCREFYSVAEHSVHVSREISPAFAFAGLMHDAAEAYIGDLPRPFKQHLPMFAKLEDDIARAISFKFRVPIYQHGTPEAEELKRADNQLLADEVAVLMAPPPLPWTTLHKPSDPRRIRCWSPCDAKLAFLERFYEVQPC